MSAWRATMPISTFSPPPPIRMGGRRTGFGSHIASVKRTCRPSKVTDGSVHRRFNAAAVSSSARRRSFTGGNGRP